MSIVKLVAIKRYKSMRRAGISRPFAREQVMWELHRYHGGAT